jgi:hypothetical protein
MNPAAGVEKAGSRGWAFPRRWGLPDINVSRMTDEQVEAAVVQWARQHITREQAVRLELRKASPVPGHLSGAMARNLIRLREREHGGVHGRLT